MKKKISREESTKTLNTLIELFPNTFFNNDKEKTKPLKCGIRHEILAQYPEHFDKNVLRVAMGFYCSRKHYFKSVLTNTSRLDLEGKLCGEITEENKAAALEAIKAINKRFAETNKSKKTKQDLETKEKTEKINPIDIDKVVAPEIKIETTTVRPKLTLKRKTNIETPNKSPV
ncbi:MAG: ProQ/FINO family protein [Methylococcales bacterium]|nr:ProQ/FINO family protein [Methylococcales bacterium]MDD5753763.1 ProQ/FINO family protein [Methylococcales bacterium]